MSGQKTKVRLIALLLTLFIASPTPADLHKTHEEFPNYFAELPPDIAQDKIHKALDSTLRRLQVPHAENGKITKTDFFLKLDQKITEKDPTAQGYISGGVVRSLLGYLYKKVYSAKQKDPRADVGKILDKIATNDKDLPTTAALGIGSDLDILVDSPKGHGGKGLRGVTEFINSASNTIQFEGAAAKFKNTLIPQGDVNDYHEQTNSTSSQGGSSLDWLAFPLPKKNGTVGAIREPSNSDGIMHHFLKGEYAYLPPPDGAEVKDKQTIRGLRPLLEIPFLKLTTAGETQLQKELVEIHKKLSNHESLSTAATEQFEKMIRNARFEGGHNRFHVSENQLEKTVLEISDLSGKSKKKLPLIPQFVSRQDMSKRKHKELPKDLSLLPVNEFINQFTDNGEGSLYHGTPKLDTVLGIIRNGMAVSSSDQGTAKLGSGVYTTGTYSTAASYTGSDGIVIRLPVRKELKPRILNLDDPKIAQSPSLAALKERASAEKRDLHEILSTEYGIDIIVNTHVLIQNAAVLKPPKKLDDLLHLAVADAKRVVLDPKIPLSMASKRKVEDFVSYSRLAHALQVPVQDTPESLAHSLLHKKEVGPQELVRNMELHFILDPANPKFHHSLVDHLDHSDPDVQVAALKLLHQVTPGDSKMHLKIAGKLNDPNREVRLNAASTLAKMPFQDESIHHSLVNSMEDQDEEVRQHSYYALMANPPKDLKSIHGIAQHLDKRDPEVQQHAAQLLGQIGSKDSKVTSTLESVLKDEKRTFEVRSAILDALGRIHPTEPSIHQTLLHLALKDPDSSLRRSAVFTLKVIQPEDIHIFSQLSAGLNDPDTDVRRETARALHAMKIKDPEVQRHLGTFLVATIQGRVFPLARSEAVNMLGEMHPIDPETLRELNAALSNPNQSIASAAQKAWDRIKAVAMQDHLQRLDSQAGPQKCLDENSLTLRMIQMLENQVAGVLTHHEFQQPILVH